MIMMNREEIEFSTKVVEEFIIVIIGAEFVGGSSSSGPKPWTIFFKDDLVPAGNMTMH